MSEPFEPDLSPTSDGIPAADAGQGAPEPAPGFGIGGEEPDVDDDQPDVPDQEETR